MRIVTRSGPWLSAFPLAAEALGDCRMCREHREVGELAIRKVHEGNGFEALKIADEWYRQIEGHSCKQWRNLGLMAPRRGRWLSVRAEKGFYDPVLKEDYRLPIGRADVLALGATFDVPSGFQVISTPNRNGSAADFREGRICNWLLNGLGVDERVRLLSDLKEV